MTTPEQTNERPSPDGNGDAAAQPDPTEPGRPRIRPAPGEDPAPATDQSGGTATGQLNPDELEPGRPRIRPGPGEG